MRDHERVQVLSSWFAIFISLMEAHARVEADDEETIAKLQALRVLMQGKGFPETIAR